MDAVSDRDFALEAVFTGSLVMTHLSRMCEEIIIWANPNFWLCEIAGPVCDRLFYHAAEKEPGRL